MMNSKSRPTRHAILGVLFLILSLLLVAPMVRIAMADQGESSSNFQVSASGNQGQVISKVESSGIEKEYKAQMDTSQGVTIHVNLNSESQNAETEIEFQANFVKLVEFADPTGVLTSNSTIIQTTDLTQLSYSPITATPVLYNGVQGYELSTQATTNQSNGFTYKVVAYAFPNSTSINATTISPSALKVVIYIMNYPYKQSNSLLALQVQTQSDRSIDTSATNSQHEVDSSDSSSGDQAVFSWNGPLTVNGQSATVKVSTTSQGDELKVLNLVYPHGSSIVHDPVIGVFMGVPFYVQPTFMLGAAAAIAVVAAMSVAIVARKLRR
jgi:hypothetical protein